MVWKIFQCKNCHNETDKRSFIVSKGPGGRKTRRGVCIECRDKYAQDNFEAMQKYRREYNSSEEHKDKKHKRDRELRAQAREYVNEYKKKPCVDCGNTFHPVAMDLDHVRGAKTRGIADMVASGYRLDLIVVEIAKCDVVCACCHRIRTHILRANLSPKVRTTKTSPRRKYKPRDKVEKFATQTTLFWALEPNR